MADREVLDVLDAIHSTRAMRYFKPDPIPEDVLWEILDAAIRGPTGANSQSWGWIVIRDTELKRQLGDQYREFIRRAYGYDRVTDEELDAVSIESGSVGIDARNRRSVVHLGEHLAEAPVLIAATSTGITDRQSPGAGGGIFGAIQNLMLAARSFGIGSVLTGGQGIESMRENLRLPEDAVVMAVIPMGYPSQGNFSEPRRRPVEEVVHWDLWGSHQDRT